jgi:eukaryotic-like serine/threonine-protein kinase
MTATRWAQIESLAAAALDHAADERRAFLHDACRGDEALRREVESLLGYEDVAEGFLQRPAIEEAARALASESSIERDVVQIPGYEAISLIGAGGMGEVYRAKEVRLERKVALKVIRSVAGDRVFVDRFEEEARTASGLNHPNIVTIYGVGNQDDVAYIVMELVHHFGNRRLHVAGAGRGPQRRPSIRSVFVWSSPLRTAVGPSRVRTSDQGRNHRRDRRR